MKSSEKMLTGDEILQLTIKIRGSGITAGVLMDLEEIIPICRQGMIPAPDAIGYTEWRDKNHPCADQAIWQAAQAAILADPMVIDLRGVEWPDWADGIRVMFCNKRAMEFKDQYGGPDGGRYENTRKIPRPIPAWQPKEGEAVFHYNTKAIFFIENICTGSIGDYPYVLSNGKNAALHDLKPATIDQLGIHWDQVRMG